MHSLPWFLLLIFCLLRFRFDAELLRSLMSPSLSVGREDRVWSGYPPGPRAWSPITHLNTLQKQCCHRTHQWPLSYLPQYVWFGSLLALPLVLPPHPHAFLLFLAVRPPQIHYLTQWLHAVSLCIESATSVPHWCCYGYCLCCSP